MWTSLRLVLRAFAASLLLACVIAPVSAALDSGAPFCVLVVEESGNLAIVDPGGRMRMKIPLGERPHEIEVSADGRTAYISMFGITDYDSRIGTPGNRITTVQLSSGSIEPDFVLPAGLKGPHGVKLRPTNQQQLFVNAEVGGDTMLVFDTVSRRLLRQFRMPKATHNFVFSSDGLSIFSFAGANGVSRTNADTGKQMAHADVGSPVRGLALTRDGNVLAAAKGELVELHGSNLGILRRLKTPQDGQFVYLAELADGTIIAPSLAHGGVAIFPKGRSPARFVKTGETALRVQTGPDGRVYVANVDDDHISVLSARGSQLGSIAGLSHPNGLSFGICPRR